MRAQWQQTLDNLIKSLEPDSEAVIEGFMAADEVLSAGFEQNFYNQVDDYGDAWPPRKDKLPHPLLIKTGRMFQAATKTTDPGHFTDIEDGTLTVGISGAVVPYAYFHHVGTRIMPSRRVIYATEETINRVVEKFADVIENSL